MERCEWMVRIEGLRMEGVYGGSECRRATGRNEHWVFRMQATPRLERVVIDRHCLAPDLS